MKAFVTGGTGFLGRHLIDELLSHGHAVTALVRTFDRARSLPRGVRVAPGDVTQRESLRSGMRGADVVFHAAAWYAVGVRAMDRERMRRINVEGTRNVLELAMELGVPKTVYTSTVAAFGDTRGAVVDESHRPEGAGFKSEYERTKYLAHFDVAVPLQRRGLPLVIVCPGGIYGPGDTSQLGGLIRRYARRRLPAMLGPDNALTWAHVDDVAAGHRLAAEKGRPGETYILAGPVLTYREFFAAAERATGLPAPRLWLPGSVATVWAPLLGRVAPGASELLGSLGGISYLAAADKARRELGWEPRSVEAGMADTLEAMRPDSRPRTP